MLYLGLDVHQRQSTLCIRNEDGKELPVEKIRGGWDQVLARLQRLPEPFQVCYEASCGYGVLYDRLSAVAQRVVVAHPGRLRLIFKSKRKNDRVDAQALCKLLYLDEVPAVHVPSAQNRAWRALIEHRQRLIRRQVQVKNQIRALLRSHGLSCPCHLWSNKGLTWLGTLDFASPFDAFRRDQFVEELRHIRAQVKRAQDQLAQVAKSHPGVALLQTIPGVGPRTAEAVVAYLDDPRRFNSAAAVGCYFGLVPCQDQSGPKNRLGHITRQGPATVRKLLTEASWQALRHSGRLKAKYQRLLRDDPDRRKIALVALSHFLVRVMWSMLMHGRPWQEEGPEGQEEGPEGRAA
jgi:transposase